MFKILVLVIVSICTASSQSPTPYGLNPELTLDFEKITSIYQQKCLLNTNPDSFRKIFSSFADTSTCIDLKATTVTANIYCTSYGKQFLSCMKNIADIFGVCLDKDEKYLPDLLINGLKRVLQKFCTDEYIDRFNKINSGKRNTSLEADIKQHILTNCLPKLNVFQNIKKGELSLKKELVCGDITTIQECLVSFFKTDYDISNDAIGLIISVFDEYRKECLVKSSTGSTTLSLTAVVASVLVLSIH